jgi:hypothetical protein
VAPSIDGMRSSARGYSSRALNPSSHSYDQELRWLVLSRQVDKTRIYSCDNGGTTMKTTQARRLAWPAASAALAVALAVLAGSGQFATSQAAPANGAAMADAIAASHTVAEVGLICTCTEYKTGYYGRRCVKHVCLPPAPTKRH